jgi:uncharacterized membrane protein YhaH (DUF805 family)
MAIIRKIGAAIAIKRPVYASLPVCSLGESPHCFSMRIPPRLRAGSDAYTGLRHTVLIAMNFYSRTLHLIYREVVTKEKHMNWYIKSWKKYAVFGGRAGRQEYWYFVLFNILVYILLSIIAGIIGKVGASLLSLYAVAVFLPGLAASVRRLHDTNRSGWWLLVMAIPGVGSIVLLVFLAQESHAIENQYGPCPQVALA